MIIGIDATRANKPHKTGVEWYCFFLIRELVTLAPDITFRLYFNSDPEPALRNLGPNVQYRIMRWPLVYLWTQIRLSLEMLFNPPDVLFIPASIIPLISAKRTVTTLHDVAYEVYKHDLSQKSRLYLRFSAYWAKWFCRKIITVSEFSKQEIIKFYKFASDRIVVTHLGLNWDSIASAASTSLPTTDSYLLYVGRLESKKNIARLIEIFTSVKATAWGHDYKLYLIGNPSRGWTEAERLIKEKNLSTDVVRTGWVSEAQKFAYLKGAKAYVHLAKYEGFGFGPLEAMAVGAPAVINNAGSLPEVCGSSALIIDATDETATVEAIRQATQDEHVRRRLITDGLSWSQRYTWEKTAEKTLEVLKSVCLN
jgi:glycosyltransferase involved in cell wall biosynthesis